MSILTTRLRQGFRSLVRSWYPGIVVSASLAVFSLAGCQSSNEDTGKVMQHTVLEEAALKHAAQLLGVSKRSVEEGYKWRTADGGSDQTQYVEFFADELVGQGDVDSMESMDGGFPGYFSIEIDRETQSIIQSYTAEE